MSLGEDNTENTNTAEQNTTNPASNYAEFLEQLTDEAGKPKYASIEDALKGAVHAQQHIKTLETDNSTLRTEKQRMEELVTQFTSTTEDAAKAATTAEAATPAPQEGATPDVDTLYAEFKARMEQEQAQTAAERNKEAAQSALKEQYGDKSEDVLKQTAQALGVSTEYLMNQAATSPKAFSKLVGLDTSKGKNSDFTGSTVNVGATPSSDKPEISGVMLGKANPVDLWNSL